MGRSWLAQLSLALTAAAAVLLIALAQPPNGRTELQEVNGVSYPDYMPWSASRKSRLLADPLEAEGSLS